MQILPNSCHFENIIDLKNTITKYFDFYKLPYERTDFNDNYLTPVKDTFEVILGRNNEKILIPAERYFPFLYRGQQFDYEPCLPTLYRGAPNEFEIFVEKLRLTEFLSLIDSHPVVDSVFKKQNFKIDYIGLAQHYGLKTNYIDLTNDIDIALFFAMCKYNKEKDTYEPIMTEGKQKAVMYISVPIFNMTIDNNFVFEDKICIIGLQPFSRPGNQKGFAYNFDISKEFKAFKYTFSYTQKESKEYFEKFDNGNALWSKDILADKAKQLFEKTDFSVDIFNKAWKLFPINKISKSKARKELVERNVSISTHNNQLTWTKSEKDVIAQKWNEEQIESFIYETRRKFWREKEGDKAGKKYNYRTLEMLEELEFLRLVGNRSGIEEYIKQNQNKKGQRLYKPNNIKKDTGWKKIPGRYEAVNAEIFLEKKDLIINTAHNNGS